MVDGIEEIREVNIDDLFFSLFDELSSDLNSLMLIAVRRGVVLISV